MDIQVYATLREVVGGKSINVDLPSETTVAQLLEQIFAQHPALRDKVFDTNGNLQPSVHLLVNGREVRYLAGLQTVVTPQDAVRIFPPVGGGTAVPHSPHHAKRLSTSDTRSARRVDMPP